MNRNATLTEEQRFPLLTEGGRKLLRWMWEHPQAPHYNFPCGDRITREGLARLRAYELELQTAQKGWAWGERPEWVKGFVERCLADVPFYRRRGGSAEDFTAIPTCERSDLDREPWSFVPDLQSLDDLIVYTTSGTTGQPMRIISHPEVSSMYLPALRLALATYGVRLEGGEGKVSIVTICAQANTYTYATVSAFLEGAGYIKINLNPNDWHSPDDCARFLDDCNPEIYTGDPFSFIALAKLSLKTRPKALVSSAMTLLPGMKTELEEHFQCPVIDVYSMNESRLIAVKINDNFQLVPHDLFVEVLDANGSPCAAGDRGEIVLTGGRNPFLPLLRYRTGDFAAIEFDHHCPRLTNFEGRPPVFCFNSVGKIVSSLDVTNSIKHLAIPQFSLHQYTDGSLLFQSNSNVAIGEKITDALHSIFGTHTPVTLQQFTTEATENRKIIQYTSDIHPSDLKSRDICYLTAQ